MADRDKVINALECCYCNFPKQMDCKNCPYDKICYRDKACSLMLRDALALLKEQEAVKPRVSSVEQRCGNCNKVIEMDGWKACPWCGKRIDWEGWWSEHEAYRRR